MGHVTESGILTGFKAPTVSGWGGVEKATAGPVTEVADFPRPKARSSNDEGGEFAAGPISEAGIRSPPPSAKDQRPLVPPSLSAKSTK